MPAAYLEESFEGAGYENSWSETEGAGCTIDEDNADVAPPAGGGSQILKMVGAGNGVTNVTTYNIGSDASDTWTTFYFRLASLGNGQSYDLVFAEDSSYNPTWRFYLSRSGGTYTARLDVYYDGSLQVSVDTFTFSLNTWYKMDIKYDITGTAWEWRRDGSPEGSGTLSGSLTSGIKFFNIRSTAWVAGFTTTAYVDRIWIDDNEYGYGTAVAAYIPRIIFIQ